MIRSLSMVLSVFATFAMQGAETRGETAEDAFLRNMIPEISCSTTAVFKNENPTELSDYQANVCVNFQSQFLEINRKLADMPNKSSIELEKFFQGWSEITGALCKEIIIGEKLNSIDYGCLFGVPTGDQPIARAMYELYLKGKLPDSYSNGSWCTTAARQENDSQKIALLKEVFGDTDDPNAWRDSEKKLLSEGFYLTPGTGEYSRALATSINSGETGEGWFSVPFPIFTVYFGQEHMPQQGELCTEADANCASQPVKAKIQDGICMTWQGFGP